MKFDSEKYLHYYENETPVSESFVKGLKKLVEEVKKEIITEEVFTDFFRFMEDDPKKNTFAYVYYLNPVNLNKNYVDENGEKVPNPLYGKVMKYTVYKFNFGDTYTRALERRNPDYVSTTTRKGNYEKVQGFEDVLEMGKSGLYLPILPKESSSKYFVEENGGWVQKEFKEIQKYFPKREKSIPISGVDFRLLVVDRILKMSAKGNKFNNPNFMYKDLNINL